MYFEIKDEIVRDGCGGGVSHWARLIQGFIVQNMVTY